MQLFHRHPRVLALAVGSATVVAALAGNAVAHAQTAPDGTSDPTAYAAPYDPTTPLPGDASLPADTWNLSAEAAPYDPTSALPGDVSVAADAWDPSSWAAPYDPTTPLPGDVSVPADTAGMPIAPFDGS